MAAFSDRRKWQWKWVASEGSSSGRGQKLEEAAAVAADMIRR